MEKPINRSRSAPLERENIGSRKKPNGSEVNVRTMYTDVDADGFASRIDDVIVKPEKRAPGRPRKVRHFTHVPKRGICEAPSNAENPDTGAVYMYELVTDKPSIFKQIIGTYRGMECGTIYLRATKDKTYLYGVSGGNNEKNMVTGNGKKSIIYTVIHGSEMNSYYCENESWQVAIDTMIANSVFNPICDDSSKVTIQCSRRLADSKIRVSILNEVDGESKVSRSELDVTESSTDWSLVEDLLQLEDNYPVKFVIGIKPFRKILTELSKCNCDPVYFEKVGNGGLKLSYALADNKGRTDTELFSGDSQYLESTLADDDEISTGVNLNSIKSITKVVNDTITIAVDKEYDLITTTRFGMTVEAKKAIIGTERAIMKIVTKVIRASSDNLI